MNKQFDELLDKMEKDFELIKQEQLAVGKDYCYYKIAVCYEFMEWLRNREADDFDERLIENLNTFKHPLSMWFDEGWGKIEDTLHDDFVMSCNRLTFKYCGGGY